MWPQSTPPPSEFAAIDMYKSKELKFLYAAEWPVRKAPLGGVTEQHLQLLSVLHDVSLHTRPPRTVRYLLLPVYVRQIAEKKVSILTFGTFRSHYRAIEAVSNTLALFYLETDILPIVRPVTTGQWRKDLESDGQLLRTIRRRGVLFYDSTREVLRKGEDS
jgi:hypothetical protein